ncbi:MAG TPA: response regulator transcription factor [Saprospiraceae bacterium]|nr:response regulator transcription factor [Saprospiraceae bacterium]
MTSRILYAEDDQILAYVTKDNLELEGYEIVHCEDGQEALNVFKKQEFDLCILDVMMPEMDGFTLGKKIREVNEQIPIIFLTAKSLKEDKIKGLKLGGDDYITKPFSIEELILKIEVFLRRRDIHQSNRLRPENLRIGQFKFDYENLTLQRGEEIRQLTQKEADLLEYLVLHKNDVLKRSDILKKVWGQDDYFLGRSLDVFISRLRKYLKADASIQIKNIHGVGFKLLKKEEA